MVTASVVKISVIKIHASQVVAVIATITKVPVTTVAQARAEIQLSMQSISKGVALFQGNHVRYQAQIVFTKTRVK